MCIGFCDRTCLCLSINSSAGSHLNRINVIAPSGVPCRGICLPIVLWLHRMRKDRQTQLYIDYMMPEWREFWQSLVHPSPVPCNLQESVLQSFFSEYSCIHTVTVCSWCSASEIPSLWLWFHFYMLMFLFCDYAKINP